MTDREDDALWQRLADLSPAVPDPVYSSNVRARCQAALARRHPRPMFTESRPTRGGTLELVVVAGFAFAYIVSVVLDALASYGVL